MSSKMWKALTSLAIVLLALSGGVAVILGLFFVGTFLSRSTAITLSYSRQQVDVLAETAKALIPAVAGFSVLAASGAGYLHSHGHLRAPRLRFGALVVFVTLMASLAGWIVVLGAMVDCSLPFNGECPVPALSPETSSHLQHTYAFAVLSARLSCLAFFLALDTTLLIAVDVFSEQEPVQDSRSHNQRK